MLQPGLVQREEQSRVARAPVCLTGAPACFLAPETRRWRAWRSIAIAQEQRAR